MEQLYSEQIPALIVAGDYENLYIATVAVLYAIPWYYFAIKGKLWIYIVWMAFAATTITMFFINYNEFCNLSIHRYVVTGLNITLSVTSNIGNCPDVINTCYYQTIQSELTYNGIVYSIATFTNWYDYIPVAPDSYIEQYFMPWDPTTPYTIDYSGITPLIYLALSIMFYGLMFVIVIKIRKSQNVQLVPYNDLPEEQRDNFISNL